MVYASGPYIGFYGCLLTGKKVHVEPLTPLFDLTTPHHNDFARETIAAALNAFLLTVPKLTDHFNILDKNLVMQDRSFPHPTSYHSGDGAGRKFSYLSQIDGKLVFEAISEDNDRLCIKYVRRYSADAHRCLAAQVYAPELRGLEALPGGWKMVVMVFFTQNHLRNHK